MTELHQPILGKRVAAWGSGLRKRHQSGGGLSLARIGSPSIRGTALPEPLSALQPQPTLITLDALRHRSKNGRPRRPGTKSSGHSPNRDFALPSGASRLGKYELMEQIGYGTYGHVYRSMLKGTDKVFALKKVKIEDHRDGFPITALREIKLLSCMSHPNVVGLKEIVTAVEDKPGVPSAIYMVFEHCEGDLQGLLRLARDGKLLEGIHYVHSNRIIHRDIKAANIFVTRDCQLKIGDWGLGRSWIVNPGKRYTDNVVTLWYRAPELLMGLGNYTTAVDIWSIGCLIAEIALLRTLLQGRDELDQLSRIFRLCGMPSSTDTLKLGRKVMASQISPPSSRLYQEFSPTSMGPEGAELLSKLLTLDPRHRWTAGQALNHNYLWQQEPVEPIKCVPSSVGRQVLT